MDPELDGSVAVAARAIAVFSCGPKARYIPGRLICVDGGLHHAI